MSGTTGTGPTGGSGAYVNYYNTAVCYYITQNGGIVDPTVSNFPLFRVNYDVTDYFVDVWNVPVGTGTFGATGMMAQPSYAQLAAYIQATIQAYYSSVLTTNFPAFQASLRAQYPQLAFVGIAFEMFLTGSYTLPLTMPQYMTLMTAAQAQAALNANPNAGPPGLNS